MPTAYDIEPAGLTLEAPLALIEAQLGRLIATDATGAEARAKAGQTIDASHLRPPLELRPLDSPCRVRIVYDSEQRGQEAKARRTGEGSEK